MAFANFNSSDAIKGRLQAALYSNRKRRRQRAEGGGTPPEPEEIFFGAQTVGGGGNWGGGTDRAMFRRLTLVSPNGSPLTVKAVHVAIRTCTGPGDLMKGLVYSDLGTATPVGQRLGFSSAFAILATGYHRLEVPEFEVDSGDNVWCGAVWSPGAFQCEFDSELVPAAPDTIMFNGTISYAAPELNAPATAAPTYANTLAAYLECSYIP